VPTVAAKSLLLTLTSVYAWGTFLSGWARMGWIDWSEQRIRHRYLVRWGMAAAAGYALLAAHTGLGTAHLAAGGLAAAWWRAWGVHVTVSVGAAALLWFLRVWPAGDVKLFVLLAVLAPLLRLPGDFHHGTFFLFALINTFVPAAVYLFLTASFYLWRTRFAHQADFVRRVGLGRAPGFLAEKGREAWGSLREQIGTWASEYRSAPGRFALDAASWIAQMGVMSLVTYYLEDRISSNFVRTLICFGLFFGWSRFAAALGKGRALGLTAAVFAGMILWKGRVDWTGLTFAFGHISVFSLCLFMGIQIAFQAVAGKAAFMALPFLFLIPSLIPFGSLWAKITGTHVTVPSVPGPLAGLGTWALMGLFFGLSIVFVRLWDAESYSSVRPDQIQPFMNLGPALVAAIEEDEEFAEEHFHAFYADGITPAQAEALREWCEDNGIETVPLAPTISFANWIYLGYFLTVLLQGHVLQPLY
jgi:hypothetical protein